VDLVQQMTGEPCRLESMFLPQGIVPLCDDARRSTVLQEMPEFDDLGLVEERQGGNPSRGIRIPGAQAAGSAPAASSGKGKDRASPPIVSVTSSSSSEPEPKRRLKRGDGSRVSETPSKRLRTENIVTAGGSSGGGDRSSPPPPPSPPPQREEGPLPDSGGGPSSIPPPPPPQSQQGPKPFVARWSGRFPR